VPWFIESAAPAPATDDEDDDEDDDDEDDDDEDEDEDEEDDDCEYASVGSACFSAFTLAPSGCFPLITHPTFKSKTLTRPTDAINRRAPNNAGTANCETIARQQPHSNAKPLNLAESSSDLESVSD
jgi:hypothetical protein